MNNVEITYEQVKKVYGSNVYGWYNTYPSLAGMLGRSHFVIDVHNNRDGKYILISYWKDGKYYSKRSNIKVI